MPIVAADGRLYIIAGYDYVGSSNVWYTQVYSAPINADGSIGTWVTEPSLPAVRMNCNNSATIGGGKIIQYGGADDSAVYQGTVFLGNLDASGNISSWDSTAPADSVAAGRQSFCVNANGKLIAVGGGANSGVVSSVRYTSLTPGSGYAYSGMFESPYIDFADGSYTRLVSIAYPNTGTGNVTLQYRYATSASDDWSVWSSPISTSPALISFTGQVFQYVFNFAGNGSQQPTVDVVTTVSGPGTILNLAPSTPQQVNLGGTKTFTASGGTGNYNWTLSTTGIGTLDQSTGAQVTFTADSEGSVTLILTDPGPPVQQQISVTIDVIPTLAPLFKEVESKKYIRFELFD
jgi:hypothetical protein